MLKINKKQSAYMVIRQVESGFTFLTLLVTLTIFSVTLPFASYLLKSVDYTAYQDEIAVQHFFQFLQDDFLEATDYDSTKKKIVLINQKQQKVTFEQYGSLIRRRLNGGNEIYLRNVRHISFQKQSHGVHVRITTEQGETYEKSIVYYP